MTPDGRLESTMTAKGYFDSLASQWSSKYSGKKHFRRRLDLLLSLIRKPQNCSAEVLDFGCGSGVYLEVLSCLGYRMYGVDSSPNMVNECFNRISPLKVCRVELIDGLDFHGDYLSHVFDCIICLAVLEYLDRPKNLLERLTSAVCPGGDIILSVPNRQSILRKLEKVIYEHRGLFSWFRTLKPITSDESYLTYQRHQFTKKELDQIMAAFGFESCRTVWHVAAGPLSFLEWLPCIGMNFITKYRKTVT